MNSNPMPTKKEYSQCIFPGCSKPLGAETKDLDYRVCQGHRECSICGKELLPIDVQIAHERFLESRDADDSLELAHSRCLIAQKKLGTLESDPTLTIKQSTYNLLNAARLMVDPDMALGIQTNEKNASIRSREFCLGLRNPDTEGNPSQGLEDLDFDKIYVHLKMLESCVETVSYFIATQDRKAIKARADLREAEKFKKATTAAKTSTRPAAKVNQPEASEEVELAKFMELFSVKERKVALELKRNRDKAIQALVKMGFPLEPAIQKCNEDMLKNRKGW